MPLRLRERDTSPPRQRSSPTRMAAAYAQLDAQGLLQQQNREAAERQKWRSGSDPSLGR